MTPSCMFSMFCFRLISIMRPMDFDIKLIKQRSSLGCWTFSTRFLSSLSPGRAVRSPQTPSFTDASSRNLHPRRQQRGLVLTNTSAFVQNLPSGCCRRGLSVQEDKTMPERVDGAGGAVRTEGHAASPGRSVWVDGAALGKGRLEEWWDASTSPSL